jgi:putative ABC transport system permease protein
VTSKVSWTRQFAKLRGLFARRKPVEDLDEEIRSHLRMEEQENLESGMSQDEAHYAALRRFGNVALAQERSRDMWGWHSLDALFQDVRYGLRQLRRSPGFTIAAVLTLALGIGANTAIFTLVNAVMLRMLPVEKPGELFQVQYGGPGWGAESSTFTNPVWEKVRDYQNVFSGAFAWSNEDKFDFTQGGVEHVANGVWVSACGGSRDKYEDHRV